MEEILILGAGCAGLTTASSLAGRTRRRGVRISLVKPQERFVERLRLHQVASGQRLAEWSIPELPVPACSSFRVR